MQFEADLWLLDIPLSASVRFVDKSSRAYADFGTKVLLSTGAKGTYFTRYKEPGLVPPYTNLHLYGRYYQHRIPVMLGPEVGLGLNFARKSQHPISVGWQSWVSINSLWRRSIPGAYKPRLWKNGITFAILL